MCHYSMNDTVVRRLNQNHNRKKVGGWPTEGAWFPKARRRGHDGGWQDSGHCFLKNMMVAGRICWRQGHVGGWAKWPANSEIRVGG